MKKIGGNKKKGKGISFIKVFDLLLLIIFAIGSGLLIFNLIKLANIETLLRIIVIIILGLILLLTVIFRNKKKILFRVLMIILSLIYGFINYAFYRVYASLDSITSKVDTKGICLVTNLNNIETIDDITKDNIAILDKKMDEQFYEMAEEVLSDEKLKNKLVDYEDYFEIINALLNKEIKYAFLPENYNEIYKVSSGEEEAEALDFKVLYTEQKVIKNETVETPVKMLDEPFTILLMGTDVMLDSYNADTLMVLSVNPKTMKVTMLSIPRDTYTTIACTGGKHKINSSGWYGDSCVVKTVGKYLGVDIDYYAKINFLGIVDLVNVLGGIEVDVPYALCEQNSKRQFGNNMIYVDAGMQTLNGEQALALSRNRHYWKGLCPAKYTTDGNRSDITRGQNQQLVIKSIVSKLMTVRDLNTFYNILDTIGDNMTTNMSKETILSFYNVGKSIVQKFNTSNADEIVNIDRLTFKSYFATVYVSGLHLSMIVNYDESVKYVSDTMKKNLGLLKEETVKKFSFDVNEEYNPETVKFNKLTSNLKLLPNFVGKPLSEAVKYCNSNGLKYESSADEQTGIIASQSISHNTDISTMRNKTIKFVLEATTNKDEDDNKNEVTNDDEPIVDDSNNTGDNSNEVTNPPSSEGNDNTDNDTDANDKPEDNTENNTGSTPGDDTEDKTDEGNDNTEKDEPTVPVTPPSEGENSGNEGGNVDEKDS